MNLLKTNNTLHFSGTRPAVAALLFALALGVSTLASAAPKRGPNAKNQPVQAQPDVCTIQVDLADVVDTNAPDGEAPLSLIVSTQTQLWTEGSSQFQTTSTALEADSVGLVSPDLVDTAVAGYILEEGTAEVVQICSAIRADNDSPHASEIHCQELVVSCDMAGEAVASDVALCLDAGSVSEDLCPSEHTAVVRFTYTFTNPDLTVNTDLSAGAHIEDSDWGVQEANTGSVDHKTANNVGACWPPMVPHDPDGDGQITLRDVELFRDAILDRPIVIDSPAVVLRDSWVRLDGYFPEGSPVVTLGGSSLTIGAATPRGISFQVAASHSTGPHDIVIAYGLRREIVCPVTVQ